MPRLSNLRYIDVRKTTVPVRRRIRSRGVPPALAEREIFYSEDVPEASELIAAALAPNRLTTGGVGTSGFAASMHGARLRDVSLLYLDLHVPVEMVTPLTGDYVAVHMPTAGRAVVTSQGTTAEANPITAVVTSASTPVTMRFDHDSPHLILRIEVDALERHLSRLMGRTLDHPIEFELEMDLTSEGAVRWHSAVQLLHTEILQTGSAQELFDRPRHFELQAA